MPHKKKLSKEPTTAELKAMLLIAEARVERLRRENERAKQDDLRDVAHIQLATALLTFKANYDLTYEQLASVLGSLYSVDMLRSLMIQRTYARRPYFDRLRASVMKLYESEGEKAPEISTWLDWRDN